MRRIYLLLVISALFFACEPKPTIPNELIIEIPNSPVKDLVLSDLVSSVKFIKLEDNDSAIVSGVDKLLIHNEHIYLLQIYKNPRLMVFDFSGEYLFDIGSQGGGPGEFNMPYDVLINKNGQVEILDASTIHIYDERNGKYLESKEIGFPVIKFKRVGDYYVFLTGGDTESKVITTNLELEIIREFRPKSLRNALRPFESFHEFDNRLLYHEKLNDTIFEIKKDVMIPHKILNFVKPLSESALQNISDQYKGDISQIRRNLDDYMTDLSFYLEDKTHVYFTYRFKGEDIILIYDKVEKTFDTYKPTGIINDVTFEAYAPFIMDVYEDGFFGYVDYPNQSMDFSNKESSPFIDQVKSSLNSDMIDFDNPLIYILKFK